MATAWRRLARAWRRASRTTRIVVASLAACLIAAGVTLSVTGLMPAGADRPRPVPPVYLAAIETSARSCPTLTPPRLAAQVMAASGFDPSATTGRGGSGIAGLTDAQWKQWAPAPDAVRTDAAANILALAHDTCDLVGHVVAARMTGDPWHLAVAAFRSGVAEVTASGGVPAGVADDVRLVAGYADWYARQPEFGGASASAPASATDGSPPKADSTPPPAAAALAGWRLTWSDEFTGAPGTPADPSNWSHDTGGTGWGNHELEYYTAGAANAALDGAGHLAITARADNAAGLGCWYGPCRYTSARLITLGHRTQTYGRISARIQLPQGPGIWPSFWALGDNIGTVGWPQAGELNVANLYGNQPTQVISGVHGPGYGAFANGTLSSGSFADGFHTFTADWYPDHISFALDGRIFSSRYRTIAGPGWVFDHPFYLLLNVAVGGDQPGDPGGTTFPQRMLVDWVRLYQPAPPTSPASGRITGLGGKCVDAAAPVQLATCRDATAQSWTLATDGTLRANGQCLGAASGAGNGSRPVLSACDGAPGQRWQAQTDGQLVHTGSGRCLDATDNTSTDGTPVQLWDCWGATNQLWAVP